MAHNLHPPRKIGKLCPRRFAADAELRRTLPATKMFLVQPRRDAKGRCK